MIFFVVLLIIVLLLLIADFYISYKMFEMWFKRAESPQLDVEKASGTFKGYVIQAQQAIEWLSQYPKDDLTIISEDGLKLQGELFHLQKKCKKVVLAMHGFHGGGEYDMARFTEFYQQNGFDACIIQQRSHENSEGRYITFSYFEQNDGILWCQKLIEIYGEDVQIVLHGVSMGGATVCMMSGNSNLPSQVLCTISDCAFESLQGEMRHVLDERTQLPVELTLFLVGIWAKLKAKLPVKEVKVAEAVKHAKVPIMFIHGGDDTFIPTRMASTLFDACSTMKSICIIEKATHATSYVVDKDKYEKEVKQFIDNVVKQQSAS